VGLATGGDVGDGWRGGRRVAKNERRAAMWVMGKVCRIERREVKRGAIVTSCQEKKEAVGKELNDADREILNRVQQDREAYKNSKLARNSLETRMTSSFIDLVSFCEFRVLSLIWI
jgi:hypothetical protein